MKKSRFVVATHDCGLLKLALVVSHHRSDVVHAPLPLVHRIPHRYIDRHAVTILESRRDSRPIAVATLKAEIPSPRLGLERLCDVEHDLRPEEQSQVIDEVLAGVEVNRQA